MAETPLTDQVFTEPDATGEDGYSVAKAEELSEWVFGLQAHAADGRKKATRENHWERDWKFIGGDQWEGPLPSYRRPVTMNAWRRALHVELAVITGGRPTLKLVPQGGIPESDLKVWQDALWALVKKEHLFEQHYPDALMWAWVGDGGWFKVGYGQQGTNDLPDVQIRAPHPNKIYPDPDSCDVTLTECSYVCFKDVLDLHTISTRYPEQGWRVKPDGMVSIKWPSDRPTWASAGNETLAPAGGWKMAGDYKRARATVVECWIDDPSRETFRVPQIVNLEAVVQSWLDRLLGASGWPAQSIPTQQEGLQRLATLSRSPTMARYEAAKPWFAERLGGLPVQLVAPEVREMPRWRWKYPYGRLITVARDVVLRDIPNPYGEAFGWEQRWPFVFVPGAYQPSTLWRAGLLSNKAETQRAINKGLSLLLENFVKVTTALVVADDNAMEDEDWDLLTLVPGAKIRKRQSTEFKVVFPEPLPAHAFQYPDYMIRKLEEEVGIHDPPVAPGQSVAAKTVAFLQQKGSFLLGIMAKMGDESLERLGSRVMALMRDRYLPGRPIPFFEGEQMGQTRPLPEMPASFHFRVEATSAFQELMGSTMAMAQAGEQAKRQSRGTK